MRNMPDKIYLQIDADGETPEDFKSLKEVSWCSERINKNDIEYINYNTFMARLTNKEICLTGRLLRMAADVYANHGCNDLDEDIWGDITKEERVEMISKYYYEYGDMQEAEEGHSTIEDFVLMRFLADEIKAKYQE